MNSIKKLTLALLAILSFQSVFADKSEWPELKNFHSVMSKTFHPAEEGNLQPVKDNSADLLAKAKAWQASPIPADFNKEETTKTLNTLVTKCEELNNAVAAKKSDEELKKLIAEAHEIFHQIVEKCQKHEGEEHHSEQKKKKGKGETKKD